MSDRKPFPILIIDDPIRDGEPTEEQRRAVRAWFDVTGDIVLPPRHGKTDLAARILESGVDLWPSISRGVLAATCAPGIPR